MGNAFAAYLRPFAGYLLILLAGLGAYLNTLSNEYTFDDQVIILKNPRIRQITQPQAIFWSSYWDSPDKGSEYRPLTIFSYAVNYALNQVVYGARHGLRPMTYHLINILLHALASCLVAWSMMALFRRKMLAILCGLLFALHPIHTEAVAGVVGRAEILAAIGFFGALGIWGYARDPEKKRKPWLLALAGGVAFALGLFSKENALTLLGVIVLDVLVFARLRKMQGIPFSLRSTIQSVWPTILAFAVIAVAYFAARYQVLGGFTRSELSRYGFADNPAFGAQDSLRVFTALRAQGEYIFLLLWPQNLIADFSFDAYPLAKSIMETGVLLGILAIALLLVTFFIGLLEAPIVAFAAGFYLITMVLTSNLFFPIGTIKAERLLYVPSLSICLLLALIFETIWNRFRSLEMRLVTLAAFAILCSAYATKTINRNPVWKNDKTLFTETIKAVPRNVKAYNNLATAVAGEKRFDEALTYLDKALQIQPDSNYGMVNKASISARKAQELLDQAAVADKNPARVAEAQSLRDAASALERTAVNYYSKAVSLYPSFVPGLFGYGTFLCLKGEYEKGLELLENAHRVDPKNLDVLQQLIMQNWWYAGSAPDREVRLGKTIDYGKVFLRLSPRDVEAKKYIGTAEFENGNYEEAVKYLKESIAASGDQADPKTIKVLGGAYYHLNKLVEAEEAFKNALQLDPNDRDAIRGLSLTKEAQRTGVRKGLRETKASTNPVL